MKRLKRDTSNQKIFGVCSGIANYFNVDVVLIRVMWICFAAFFGSGVLAYLLAALVMPKD